MQGEPAGGLHWWESRSFVVAAALITIIPLIWPVIPPLVDLPGHMGRYRVQLDYNTSAVLQEYYSIQWRLIGNLGIDLLIIPLSKIFGLEFGVKLIVMAIPALTVIGLLSIAREVHGRIPPTALFALPLAYGHPFMFGFVNFTLSMALGLCAFALWLRMARLGDTILRAIVFAPISILLWVCHTYGWGMLGVLAFSAELVRQYDSNRRWYLAPFHAAKHCLALSVPVLLMILWRSGTAVSKKTETYDWFNWMSKWRWLYRTLRDRWEIYDETSLAIIALVLVYAIVSRKLTFSRNLFASALFLAVVFVLLPRVIFGSAYADMRLTPYMIAIAVVAIRLKPKASTLFTSVLAVLGLTFFGVRTLGTTASFKIASQGYDAALPALDHVPEGARLVTFVGYRCGFSWATNRMEHLPGIALVRRRAFSNDQWDMAGAQLLLTRRPEAGRFRGDPSQVVTSNFCRDKWRTLDWALIHFPRDAFDYVWIVDPPRYDPANLQGLTPIWQNGPNALYRVDHGVTPTFS